MVETSWTRRSARAAVASLVLAPLLIAATAAGPAGRPWVPPACPDPPHVETGGRAPVDGARYQLEPVLVDGELRGQRVTVANGAFRPRSVELAAESFAAGPFGDAVLIGTDDGTHSTLSLIDVRRGCAWLLATASDVIRSATIDPAGRQLHEARVDRVTRADLGIWRRPVEAADEATPALEPIVPDPRFGRTFSTGLAWSEDGSRLAVTTCGALACRVRVLDPASGRVALIADPAFGDVVGLTGDRIVAHAACPGLPCPLVSVPTRGGQRIVLARDGGLAALATASDGAVRVVLEVLDPGRWSLRSVAPDGTQPTDLGPLPTDLRLLPGGSRATGGVALPPGWTALAPDALLPATARAAIARHITDGRAVPLVEVPR